MRIHLVRACFCTTLMAGVLCLGSSAYAQQPGPVSPVPDAPLPAAPERSGIVVASSHSSPGDPLTLGQRFAYESRFTFGPAAFVIPALGAGYTLADPPERYPHDWRVGAGGFARNYGAILGANTVDGLTHFAAAAALHEDPRYYPIPDRKPVRRVLHALAFTIVDRSDSGHATFAASNFIAAGAGGFVGMAWEPAGWDDTTHAYQRASIQLARHAARNLLLEFDPEISHTLQKLHLAHSRD